MAIKKIKSKIPTTKLYDSWIEDLKNKGTESTVYVDDDALNALVENKPSKMDELANLPKIGELIVQLDHIEITTPPNKIKYNVGDNIDTTGMIVKAYYTDNTNSIITNYTIDINRPIIDDDTEFIVSYTYKEITKTCNQPIESDRVLSSISISTVPNKVEYKDNESFNPDGMIITAHFTDGDTEVLGYTYSPNGILSTTDTKVTISYTFNGITKTVDQSITVTPHNQYLDYYSSKNVGDIITIPHNTMGNIDFIVIGKDQDGEGNLTLLSKNIIKLMPFDAKESSNTDSYRQIKGNGRYSLSNILQWMNSNASSNWYSAKHSYDAIPNSDNVEDGYDAYDNVPGFLYGFDNDFKNALTTVSKRTALNKVTDGGGYEDVSSKMFLLSTTEVGLYNENNIEEGSIYQWFSNNNTNDNRIAYPTEYAINNNGYVSNNLSTSKGWYWWLRTPVSGTSHVVWDMSPSGQLSNNYVYHGYYGLRVACVISNTLESSKTLDSISISTPPTKTNYVDGNIFESAGMVVNATYTDGSTGIISDYSIDKTTLSTTDNSVTISYTLNGVTKTTTQSIVVTPYINYKELYNIKNVGDIITIPHSIMGNIDFIVIGKDQDGSGKLTLLSKNIIKIMPFDAKESSNTDTNRAKYGNNRYSMSNILQWMNSNASSNWYTSKHSYDAIPNSSNISNGDNPYDSIPGFLYGFNNDFKTALTTVSKKTVLPNIDGGGYEDVSSKMFLLSRTEVGVGTETGIAEGSAYTYFNNNNTNDNRKAYPTSYAVSNSEYTHINLSISTGWSWWLRTPQPTLSYGVRIVDSGGSVTGNHACDGSRGLRVACVI